MLRGFSFPIFFLRYSEIVKQVKRCRVHKIIIISIAFALCCFASFDDLHENQRSTRIINIALLNLAKLVNAPKDKAACYEEVRWI